MKLRIQPRPLAGFLFVSITGTLLHFLYDRSGQSFFVGLFSAVNESIWEHMKLLFFPMVLWALFQSQFNADTDCCFWCVKLFSITLGLTLIPVLYYTYTGALGVWADWFNITIFFLTAGAAFGLEHHLFRRDPACPLSPRLCCLTLYLIAGLFVIFTFFPPHIPLFQDPITGSFGLLR